MSGNLKKYHWMLDASCKDQPTEWFVSFEKELNDKGRAVCATCPVKRPCLIDGFDSPYIRAGLSKYERLVKIWHRIDSTEDSNFD